MTIWSSCGPSGSPLGSRLRDPHEPAGRTRVMRYTEIRALPAGRDALAVLAAAPTPTQGRGLSTSRIAALLRRAGRQRLLEQRAAAIRDALRRPALSQPAPVEAAFGAGTAATVAVMLELRAQADRLEAQLGDVFWRHPDAEILRSLPGLGLVLGARVLGEFGDAPNRYADAKARRNYAG